MRVSQSAAIFAIWFAVLCAVQLWPEDAPTVSLGQYEADLSQWSRAMADLREHPQKVAAVRTQVPPQLHIRDGEIDFNYDNGWLERKLNQFSVAKTPDGKSAIVETVQQRLQSLSEQAQAFSQPSIADVEQAALLHNILSRREFRAVRGPSTWEKIRDKAIRWVLRILEKVFTKAAAPAQVGQGVVWVLIAAALSVLAIWLKRRLAQTEVNVEREILTFSPPSRKSWRKWIAEAEQAAGGSNWREALHCVYWASISRLEAGGAWRPDNARTPREYLRLLSGQNPDHGTLQAITKSFEPVWYGNRNADRDTYELAAHSFQELRCRP